MILMIELELCGSLRWVQSCTTDKAAEDGEDGDGDVLGSYMNQTHRYHVQTACTVSYIHDIHDIDDTRK
jgi:hypothetical protein